LGEKVVEVIMDDLNRKKKNGGKMGKVAECLDAWDITCAGWEDTEDGETVEEFAELCNQVLMRRYPDVLFMGPSDINLMVAGNGYKDVTSEIDYGSVICDRPENLRAELMLEQESRA
jgi:hypothetical protein